MDLKPMLIIFSACLLLQAQAPRLAVPDAPAVDAARSRIREVLATDFKEAKSNEGKTRLAEKLLGLGRDGKESPVNRRASFVEARELYVEISDLLGAFGTIDSMSQIFDEPPYQQKIDLVQRFSKIAKNAVQKRALAAVSLKLAKEAARAGDYRVAKECCQTAVSSARGSADATLQTRATDQLKRIENLFDEWQSANDAGKVLESSPNNPEASIRAGRFKCLVKCDWDNGLSLLARSSEVMLFTTANADLAKPSTRDAQLSLGEAWLKYAEGQKDPLERAGFAHRAVFWLEKAVASLEGLERTAAEKRLITANELACDVDFKKLLNRKANGLEVETKVDCRPAIHSLKLKPTFELRKSWVLSLEFQPPNLDGGLHQVFFWGDGRGGKDPLFLRLDGNQFWASCTDCSTGQGHALMTHIPGNAVGQWVNVKFLHDALIGEIELYVNYRLAGRTTTSMTPAPDKGMPLCLGGTDGSEQRFVGQARNVWLGNIP